MNPKGNMLIGIDREALRRAYEDEGLTQEECAYRFFCSQATIGNYMKIYGIKARQPNDRRHRLYDVGGGRQMTAPQIAEIAGITTKTVYRRYSSGVRGKDLLEPQHAGRRRGWFSER